MIQKNHGHGARRALAVLGTVALALGGVLASGSAAQAAEDDPPPVGNIVGTEGTLTIHKHAGNPTGDGNGQEIDDTNLGIGVDGIEFTIARVSGGSPSAPINLTTTAGWDLAKTASDGFNPTTGALPAGFTSATVDTWTTSGGGIATGTLPFGLYLVTEVANDAVESPAAPFLVSIPYPSSGTWLYNVHVYPKNELKDITTKTVSTPVSTSGAPAVVEGSRVTWTITAAVPRVDDNIVENFTITDPLDGKLKYVSAVVKLDGVTLTAGANTYSLTHTGADATTGQGGTVVIDLVGTTLAGLKTGQVVTVELVTEVHGEGQITNIAVRNVNDTDTDIGEPQTNWGKVKVIKSNAQQLLLSGAMFELYTYDAVIANRTLVYAATGTDGNGEILFPAVWLGNGTDTTRQYCLKETQAPPGYVTPTGDAAWSCLTLTSVGTAIVEKPLTNTQQTGPNLPLTGSTGTAIFMIGGLALIAAAAGAGLMVSRKRRDEVTHH
jgi:fimbrial isopeptide formation D2 family protein/LPXTG-motif cell wall-anchored protein